MGKQPLDFGAALTTLAEGGLRFSSTLFVHRLDLNGEPLTVSSPEFRGDLASWVREVTARPGHVAEVSASDENVAVTLSLGSQHETGLLSINISRKTWSRLGQSDAIRYQALLLHVAIRTGAGGVLVIDDPADDFLGNLEPVDEQWPVELGLPGDDSYDPGAVWLHPDSPPDFVVGLRLSRPTGRVVHRMREYREQRRR